MATFKLVTCPYDEAHKVKENKLQTHISKCKLQHLDDSKFICPFNATHIRPRQERDYHMLHCPDKAPLDRKLAESLDRNNPFKGRTAVPSYSESAPIECDEVWDVDEDTAAPGYVPDLSRPIDGIVEPAALSKPAVRRQLYKELHQMPKEHEFRPPPAAVEVPIPAPKPRQPVQQSEAARLQQQAQNTAAYQNLGLGRGKAPSSRIAANIFPSQPLTDNSNSTERTYSGVITNSMRNLGLGRGVANNAVVNETNNLDDDEFPALGFGRGIRKPARQDKPSGRRW